MTLLILAGQALLIAAALFRARENRRANRLLALLLIVLAGMMVPYIIGYAGFYDRYPWLSFAPFAVPLAVGPLCYAHLHALVSGGPLPLWHWLPPAAQFLNQALVFPFPLAAKNWFDDAIQLPYISPVAQAGLILSLALYGWAGFRIARTYRRRGGSGAGAVRRLRRLQGVLAALGLLLIARAAVTAYDSFVAPLDYGDRFPFYLLLGLLTCWLAVEGWRHAGERFPPLGAERDWRAQGEAWIAQVRAGEWWRDPDLSLEALARRLGTNSSHLSRALGAAGSSFSDLLAAARAEEVARRIEAHDGADLLNIALESGFGSKASFNRAFRQRFGVAPSDYRRERLNA